MKSLLTTLAAAAALAFFTVLPSSAQDDSSGETRAECLQRCFDQYTENLEACQDACWVCDVWILFCISGHTDEECFANCSAEARRVHEACKRECPPEVIDPSTIG